MTIRRKSGHMEGVSRPTVRMNRAVVQQNLERLKQITSRPQDNPPTTPEATPTASGRQQQDVPAGGAAEPKPLQKEKSETPEHMLHEAGEQAIRAMESAEQRITHSISDEPPNSSDLVREAQQIAQRAVANAVGQAEASIASFRATTANAVSYADPAVTASEKLARQAMATAQQQVSRASDNTKVDISYPVEQAQQAARQAIANAIRQTEASLAQAMPRS